MADVPDDYILSPSQAAELVSAAAGDADALLNELSQLSAVPAREERGSPERSALDVRHLAADSGSLRAGSVSSGLSAARWTARPARRALAAQRAAMTPGRAEDFSRRQELWAAKRQLRLQEQRTEHARKSELDASFHPQLTLNKHARIVAQRRHEPVFARLTKPPPPAPTPAQQAAMRWRERQEELDERECTFAPDTALSRSSFEMVKSRGRFRSAVLEDAEAEEKQRARKQRPAPTGEVDGMFLPRTNAVARDMVNAHAYLALPVFDRLSKPFEEGEELGDRAEHSSPAMLSKEEAEAAQLRFLRRQNEREVLRQERMRRIESEATSEETRQPQLCARSRALAKRARPEEPAPEPEARRDTEDFVRQFANLQARLAQDVAAGARADAQRLRSPERSPSPGAARSGRRSPGGRSLSPAKRPPRGFEALSKADWEARQAKIEQLRQRLQQDYTFKPALRTKPARVGRTRPLDEDFIERCRSELTQREDRLALQQAEAQEREMQQCTFQPNKGQGARPLPLFIQRIAEMHRHAARTRDMVDATGYAAAR